MDFLNCFVYLALIGIVGFWVGRIIPAKWICADRFPYKAFTFEQDGKIYEKLKIRKWQNRVPDMSKYFPKWIPAKKLDADLEEKLPTMIRETCIAETIHVLLGLFALRCLLIRKGIGGILVTVLYELGNLPYVLIQRYNRPRLQRLQRQFKQRASSKHPVRRED